MPRQPKTSTASSSKNNQSSQNVSTRRETMAKNGTSNKPVPQVCRRCHRQKRKCNRGQPKCERCAVAGEPCEYLTEEELEEIRKEKEENRLKRKEEKKGRQAALENNEEQANGDRVEEESDNVALPEGQFMSPEEQHEHLLQLNAAMVITNPPLYDPTLYPPPPPVLSYLARDWNQPLSGVPDAETVNPERIGEALAEFDWYFAQLGEESNPQQPD
ncbi:hypothetical protein DM02DRAFT_676109 [Periconia macrospinosa]|uniref:Zn(2)-C6 fungal-type domain-containing protein n=1 Tax=Periconia macrospinosa TaxID=97972 RepID=A0A2V1D8V1_9PLEO|nr:hypothetical protein DM02DRAFT_676109 [Periconia macrospinosa]